MPFIAQCPHCSKYMLLEDSLRDTRTECLLCKLVIPVAVASVGGVQPASSLPAAPPMPPPLPSVAPPSRDWRQLQCPQCQATLRVPGHIVNQPVRCKNCQHVFQA